MAALEILDTVLEDVVYEEEREEMHVMETVEQAQTLNRQMQKVWDECTKELAKKDLSPEEHQLQLETKVKATKAIADTAQRVQELEMEQVRGEDDLRFQDFALSMADIESKINYYTAKIQNPDISEYQYNLFRETLAAQHRALHVLRAYFEETS
jgi:hypothetical protein